METTCKVSNYTGKGAAATLVEIGNLEIYFSYETPIAFRNREGNLVVSENVWSATTGRHITALGVDKKARVPRDEFERQLDAYLRDKGL